MNNIRIEQLKKEINQRLKNMYGQPGDSKSIKIYDLTKELHAMQIEAGLALSDCNGFTIKEELK
tara:strand:+ start:63 stop:254 length:192 start_codon:yes stop_codon:yes gene_type:complete